MQRCDISCLIETALLALPAGSLCVGFSGGMDSSVLLHALAESQAARARGLCALHVDHGLHADSAAWARHCGQFAERLDVALDVRNAHVVVDRSQGVEASARKARFAAFAAKIGAGGVIALAHHQGDQTETLLLKLLRGAGSEGLAAMRECRRFERGWLWRPLLSLPRAVLRAYAERHALDWIDDPSNADTRLDRNYLRSEVLPLIAARWPHMQASLAQSAAAARDAADFIDSEAKLALERIRGSNPATLRWRDWLILPAALRDAVLRRWLRALGFTEPNRQQAGELIRQLDAAADDRSPRIAWVGAELRRYRDLLFALPTQANPPRGWSAPFDGAELRLPADLGVLRLSTPRGPLRLPRPLEVRLRRGGERLRLRAHGPTRDLRDLLQEAGVPPWQRGRMPLLFDADGALLAVADRWRSVAGNALLQPLEAKLEWRRS